MPTFFVLENTVPLIFGRLYKRSSIQTYMHFLGCSHYFGLFFCEREQIKWNPKKYGSQTVSSICKKNFQLYQTYCDWESGTIRGSFVALAPPAPRGRKHQRLLSLAQSLLYALRSIHLESFKVFWLAVLQKCRKEGREVSLNARV